MPPDSPALWITCDSQLAEIVKTATSEGIYAVDTEFISGTTYQPTLALVQIAAGSRTWLIDALSVDLTGLAPLFSSDALMVLHACAADLPLLRAAAGVLPANIFDTQIAASFLGTSSPSLASLVRDRRGIELDKSSQMTDWTRRPLSKKARDYAAADVAYLESMALEMRAELTAAGRLAWAQEEFAAALIRGNRPVSDPDDAWMRIKGVGTMSHAQRRHLAALAAWRERQAIATDRRPQRVLADEVLAGLSRELTRGKVNLRTHAALAKLRGPALSHLEEDLAAIDFSRTLEVVREPRLERSQEAFILLCTVTLAALAASSGVDATLMANRADLVGWLCGTTTRLAAGWRSQFATPVLDSLRAGKLSVLASPDLSLSLVEIEPA
jgi:ribonuclease D